VKNNVCRICGNSYDNLHFNAREMMYGTREEFKYFQCSKCECLQILNFPIAMDSYYPTDYYSYIQPQFGGQNAIKMFIKKQRTLEAIDGRTLFRSIFSHIFGPSPVPKWMKGIGLSFTSSILDVGCGVGHLLLALRQEGFENLQGVDPFIERDIFYENGVEIQKKSIEEIDGNFDLIMMNHSLEHIEDQVGTLRTLTNKMKSGGTLVIRVPTVSSYAWRHYGINWVQLDAPRHFYLHSVKSIHRIASDAGLAVDKIEYDSNAFQFWASEQYSKDIPMNDMVQSYGYNQEAGLFEEDDIKEFSKRALILNDNCEGDQACFFLKLKEG